MTPTDTPTPPPLPPHAGGPSAPEIPIRGVFTAMEALLRRPADLWSHLRKPEPGPAILALLLIAAICMGIYGVVIGTFAGGDQLWAAPLKVVLGLMISALICLPSLYIFACLGGAKARLIEVLGLLAGLLALMTILLVGFAPIAWIFGQSTDSLGWMGFLHLGFWSVALGFALRFFFAGFRILGEGGGAGLKAWMVLFVLVMLQMTTALRPILGQAPTFLPPEKRFFLSHWTQHLKAPTPAGAEGPLGAPAGAQPAR